MSGWERLLIAFSIFAVIDLIFVGTTTLSVVHLVKRIINGEVKIVNNKGCKKCKKS